jgi:putative DNA primase/helicase
MSDVAERARGRWPSILPMLGVSPKHLTGKHGPCPSCGGKDRFRFDNKDGRGSWICAFCGAGDGLGLAMLVTGLSFHDVARRIEAVVGSARVDVVKPEDSAKRQREARELANSLWLGASSVRYGDSVSRWLAHRVGQAYAPPCLRYHPALPYRHDNGQNSNHPAMLALVIGPAGKPASLHRTYLTEEGRKAEVDKPRKLLPGLEVPRGSAVRLWELETAVLGIAEGIETAFSACKLFSVPVWAALCARGLETWQPPEGVRKVLVFPDNDTSGVGQAAAAKLAKRLTGAGLEVSVHIPSKLGQDWNDVHRGNITITSGALA